jgi:ABC-type transporter Mla subunit MlaD
MATIDSLLAMLEAETRKAREALADEHEGNLRAATQGIAAIADELAYRVGDM